MRRARTDNDVCGEITGSRYHPTCGVRRRAGEHSAVIAYRRLNMLTAHLHLPLLFAVFLPLAVAIFRPAQCDHFRRFCRRQNAAPSAPSSPSPPAAPEAAAPSAPAPTRTPVPAIAPTRAPLSRLSVLGTVARKSAPHLVEATIKGQPGCGGEAFLRHRL